MPDTTADNDEWIARKNRVARRFEHSTFYMGTLLKGQNATMDGKYLLDPRLYAPTAAPSRCWCSGKASWAP